MTFGEKIQKLRTEMGLTQEQLAKELYVSRTAISKWESNRGYPNIESLKQLSKIFSVSIDDLLSGEELVSLAEEENQSNRKRIFSFVIGLLDLLTISFWLLPLYGQSDGKLIRMVNLLSLKETSSMTQIIYMTLPTIIALAGVVEIIWYVRGKLDGLQKSTVLSTVLHILAVSVFILTRQPYATMLMFMLFLFKVVIIVDRDRQ